MERRAVADAGGELLTVVLAERQAALPFFLADCFLHLLHAFLVVGDKVCDDGEDVDPALFCEGAANDVDAHRMFAGEGIDGYEAAAGVQFVLLNEPLRKLKNDDGVHVVGVRGNQKRRGLDDDGGAGVADAEVLCEHFEPAGTRLGGKNQGRSRGQEGLDLLRRSQPLPPLRADQPGESVELIVPVQFYLKL